MSSLKRALIMLSSNKGQTLVWFVVFLITIGFMMIIFFANDLYQTILDDVFKDGNVPVYVIPEMPKGIITEATSDTTDNYSISEEIKNQIGDSSLVTSVDKSFTSQMTMEDISVKDTEILTSNGLNANYIGNISDVESEEGFELLDTIVDNFSSDSQIILNEKLLDEINLQIGDKITLDLNQLSSESDGYEELSNLEFEIVGSYKFEPTQQMIDQERENAAKFKYEPDFDFTYTQAIAFVPQTLAEKIINLEQERNSSQSIIYSNYTYYLDDISNLSDFKMESEKIAGIPLDVEVNTMNLPDGKITVNNLNLITMTANTFATIGLTLVGFMLIIISILFIRGRKNEIGILLALGAEKKTIYFQLFIELLIPMLVSILIMYFLGTLVCIGLVSNIGLGQALLLTPLVKALLIGLLLVIIATLIPAIVTMRSQPKKILM